MNAIDQNNVVKKDSASFGLALKYTVEVIYVKKENSELRKILEFTGPIILN